MIDHVSPNTPDSSFPANFYIVEDNEPVIRMILKGHRPNLIHMSRTHRGHVDRLFERTDCNSFISIRFVLRTDQLADILTKDVFTVP